MTDSKIITQLSIFVNKAGIYFLLVTFVVEF